MNASSDRQPRKLKVVRHTDLDVYQRAFTAAMDVFRLSKTFPAEERYSLTDQGRRSSRSVAANIAEAWPKRRYPASFVSKLNDAEGEAAETQTWLQFPVECGYANSESARVIVYRIRQPHRHARQYARPPGGLVADSALDSCPVER